LQIINSVEEGHPFEGRVAAAFFVTPLITPDPVVVSIVPVITVDGVSQPLPVHYTLNIQPVLYSQLLSV
jgi:hypothetical protein